MKKNAKLQELLGKSLSLSQRFHQKTKITRNISTIDPKDWPESWKEIYFKSYPRLNEIILPEPKLSPKISLSRVLNERMSSRVFSRKPVSKLKLGSLLFYSLGLKNKKPPFLGRFYPSPGGRYPLEAYLIVLNAEIPNGIYHYYLKNHSLEELMLFNKSHLQDYKFDFDRYFPKQDWLPSLSIIILITAVFKRNTVKYGDRGYRHVLVEAGHVGQNLYLNCSALGLACCGIGGYKERELERLLDIDGVNESVIYALGVGHSI